MDISDFATMSPFPGVTFFCAIGMMIVGICLPFAHGDKSTNKTYLAATLSLLGGIVLICVSLFTFAASFSAHDEAVQEAISARYGIEFSDQSVYDIMSLDDATVQDFVGVRDGETEVFGISYDDKTITIFEQVNEEYLEIDPND